MVTVTSVERWFARVDRQSASADRGQGHDRGHREGEGEGHVGLTLIADVRCSTINVVNSLLEMLVILHVSKARFPLPELT